MCLVAASIFVLYIYMAAESAVQNLYHLITNKLKTGENVTDESNA